MSALHLGRLLDKLDTMAHPARLAHAARTALTAERASVTAAIDALIARGDCYHGVIGLEMARAVGDVARAAQLTEHPSMRVALRAVRCLMTRMQASDEAIAALLPLARPAVRAALLPRVGALRSGPVWQALFAEYADRWSARELAQLLPALPADQVAQHLPRLGIGSTVARRHPGAVRSWLRDQLTAAPPNNRVRVWSSADRVIAILCRHDAQAMAELMHQFRPPVSTLVSAAKVLACKVPAELMRLAIGGSPADRQAVVAAAPGQAPRLSDAQLAQLLAPVPSASWSQWLRRLPMARRAATYQQLIDTVGKSVRIDADCLWLLPRALLASESQRMLARRDVAEDPLGGLPYLAGLPYADAAAQLTPHCKSNEAEVRAAALRHLIRAAGRASTRDDGSPEAPIRAALAQVLTRRNDQDPVKQQMFRGLAELPVLSFTAADVAALEELATSASTARDLSHVSRTHLTTLAHRLLRSRAHTPTHPLVGAALTILERLAGIDGVVQLGFSTLDVPVALAPGLVDALLPRLSAGHQRGQSRGVIMLAHAMGRAGRGQAKLESALWQVVKNGDAASETQAAALLLAHHGEPDQVAERLVHGSPSLPAACRELRRHLHLRRQDLIDPYLDRKKPVTGRHIQKRVFWAWAEADDFFRWLPRQQAKQRDILVETAADAKQYAGSRAWAIRTIAQMPIATPEDLRRFVATPDVADSEAALAAHSSLDQPSLALTALEPYLDTDRARVAMYEVRAILPWLTAEASVAWLRAVLERVGRITVRKEVLRLLAGFRPPGIVEVLAHWAGDDQHKDLRIAASHGLLTVLDLPGAMPQLERLLSAAAPDVALSILRTSPVNIPSAQQPTFARAMLIALRHGNPRVRSCAQARIATYAAGVERPVAQALAAVVLDPAQATWAAATHALAQISRGNRDTREVCQRLLADLVARSDEVDSEPRGERDRPFVQRAMALIQALIDASLWEADHAAWLASLGPALIAQPAWCAAGAAMALVACDPASPVTWSRSWMDHASVSALAVDIAQWLGAGTLPARVDRLSLGSALPAWCQSLSAECQRSALLGHLALRAVQAHAPLAAYAPPIRDVIAALRQHSDPLVRHRAGQLFWAAEQVAITELAVAPDSDP